jgi:hypothetical protein
LIRIAAEFRSLPRPLVQRYDFHPERTRTLSGPSPFAHETIVEPACYEPILSSGARRFLDSHHPLEIAVALWPYKNDEAYRGDVATLLGSFQDWRMYWPCAPATREQLEQRQRDGKVWRGARPSVGDMLASNSQSYFVPRGTLAGAIRQCYAHLQPWAVSRGQLKDAVSSYDQGVVLFTFAPLLEIPDARAFAIVAMSLADESPVPPSLLPQAADEMSERWREQNVTHSAELARVAGRSLRNLLKSGKAE